MKSGQGHSTLSFNETSLVKQMYLNSDKRFCLFETIHNGVHSVKFQIRGTDLPIVKYAGGYINI